eukprot:CAMPEP_0118869782 /NCGR_PEP_ID=MMETSP1163-20130328/13002_1 /TAXON_ID=124430 /ORGANISM="Phaeomonas parva, Strain CCMP2877" /LENGTH=266 /DNA_ID=CAMNT_0006804713 /DNA_START=196 /DNA_END=993 /DNA_ORIENTATION=+
MVLLADINKLLRMPRAVELRGEELCFLLDSYTAEHEPQKQQAYSPFGPNLRKPVKPPTPEDDAELRTPQAPREDVPEDLAPIIHSLSSERTWTHRDLCPLMLKALRILLRKDLNRRTKVAEAAAPMLIQLMEITRDPAVAKECVSCFINLFYRTELIMPALRRHVLRPLQRFISGTDRDLLLGALGVLQCICYTKGGRGFVCANAPDVAPTLVQHLGEGVASTYEDDVTLQIKRRAMETLHNLSTDGRAIAIMREAGIIPPLVSLL